MGLKTWTYRRRGPRLSHKNMGQQMEGVAYSLPTVPDVPLPPYYRREDPVSA
jgi:hypothetical protein